MFKFKKLTAIALVAVAAMGLLAGCGSEKSKMLFNTLPLVRFFSIMFSARLPSSLPNVQSLHCQTGQLLSVIDSKPYND